jgi:Gpi18-like mannosyltransferase
MAIHDYQVVKWAFISRLTVVCLSILSSSIVPTYDLSFAVRPIPFKSTLETTTTTTEPITSSKSMFDSLARWDGVYFIRLAETNVVYEFEQFHAFFPLLPKVIHKCTHLLSPLFPFQTETSSTITETSIPRSHYIFVGILITNGSFIIASFLLYRLGALLFNQHKAYTSTILFIVSPASIFFSSVYSKFIPVKVLYVVNDRYVL